jgi:hypothetical protein
MCLGGGLTDEEKEYIMDLLQFRILLAGRLNLTHQVLSDYILRWSQDGRVTTAKIVFGTMSAQEWMAMVRKEGWWKRLESRFPGLEVKVCDGNADDDKHNYGQHVEERMPPNLHRAATAAKSWKKLTTNKPVGRHLIFTITVEGDDDWAGRVVANIVRLLCGHVHMNTFGPRFITILSSSFPRKNHDIQHAPRQTPQQQHTPTHNSLMCISRFFLPPFRTP